MLGFRHIFKPQNVNKHIENQIQMIIFKPSFTINEIGKKQFYLGLIIGLGYSIIFNYLLRLITLFANFSLSRKNPYFINLENYDISQFMLNLIGISSVCFGFTFTTYIWLSKLNLGNKKLNIRKRYGQANSLFIIFTCFLFLIRLWNFFIQNPISLEKDFGLYCYLLPIFIFLYNWNLINRIYKVQKMILVIVPLIIIIGKLLSLN